MTSHTDKAQALADKITAKAADALSGLDREMTIMKWPAEYRRIMWEAVAHEAANRACEAREQAGEKQK